MLNFFAPGFAFCGEKAAAEVDRLAYAMACAGMGPGEPIAARVDISVHGVFLLVAAIKMGLKVAICDLREPPAVISPWLSDLGIKKLVSSCDEGAEFANHVQRFSVDDLLRSVNNDARPIVSHPNDFSSVTRTSGTSGLPKSALIMGDAHLASARSVNDYFSYTKSSCWALSLPLYHVSGLGIIFRSLLACASIYLAKNHDDLLYGLREQSISHLSLVPTQLKRLLDDGADFSGVQAIIIGGDALPEKLRRRALLAKLPVFETYGLTETASMVWVRDCLASDKGRLLPHAIMQKADDGEFLVGGDSLFAGYVDGSGVLKKPTIDGLFPTGDVGQMSLAGQLQLICRKSNRIISGGENIQAEEIERVLEEHPLILESVVVGVADDDFGMRPLAYIKWVNEPLTAKELCTYLLLHLAPYKVPKNFSSWPPDAPSGPKKPRRWFLALSKGLL